MLEGNSSGKPKKIGWPVDGQPEISPNPIWRSRVVSKEEPNEVTMTPFLRQLKDTHHLIIGHRGQAAERVFSTPVIERRRRFIYAPSEGGRIV